MRTQQPRKLFPCATTNGLALAMVALTTSPAALAAVPDLLPVQGVLSDDAGVPLAGPVDLLFAIYDSESGSSELFSEALSQVPLDGGAFAVSLGATQPLYLAALAGAGELWLEVSVGGEVLSRVQLQSVPYAVSSYSCESLGGLGASDLALASHSHAEYSLTTHLHDARYIRAGQRDSVGLAMMYDGSVGTDELIDESVTTAKLGLGAVTSATLGLGAVTSANIGVDEVQGANLAPRAVTSGKIATDAVTRNHIPDHELPASKLEGGVFNLKTSVQTYSGSVQVAPGQVREAKASCADANDLPLFGECVTGSAEKVDLVKFNFLDVSNETAAASYNCAFRSYDTVATISVAARIYCLPVDGP
ncbi:MAG: hypothetical protein ABIJ09_26905 [Pseudomonadota bacterium]